MERIITRPIPAATRMIKLTDATLAYTLARVGMGVNMFFHGAVRIPKLGDFVESMNARFEPTVLPPLLVTPFAYSLPFFEAAIGILLTLGLLTRSTLLAASLLIIALIFGTCLLENWHTAGSQMIYLAYLTGLLALRSRFNQLSVDQKRA